MKMQRNKQPNNKYTQQQQIHRHSLIPLKKEFKKKKTPPPLCFFSTTENSAFSVTNPRGNLNFGTEVYRDYPSSNHWQCCGALHCHQGLISKLSPKPEETFFKRIPGGR